MLQALVSSRQLSWEPIHIWNAFYSLLLVWKDDPTRGAGTSCNITVSEQYQGCKLGEWLLEQITAKWQCRLLKKQEEQLQSLVNAGYLSWEPSSLFEGLLQLLLRWRDEKGNGQHCNVPQGEMFHGWALGQWLLEQQYSKLRSQLHSSRVAKLKPLVDTCQMSWEPQPVWDTLLGLLKKWLDDPEKGKGETCDVPFFENYEGWGLGQWLWHQREDERLGQLLASRKSELQQLVDKGKLTWSQPSLWDNWFELLLKWRDDPAHGKGAHCNVPRDDVYEGWNLGQWLWAQQISFWSLKLTAPCQSRLQALVDARSLTWEPDCVWNTLYSVLLVWRDDPAKGCKLHCMVPSSEIYYGWALGSWLWQQIKAKWQGKLPKPREASLQGLVEAQQLSWETSELWETLFHLLLKWKDDPAMGEGQHCNVPQECIYDGWPLGVWLERQKYLLSRNGMQKAQRDKLSALMSSGVLNWQVPQWNARYSLLLQWRDDPTRGNGVHCNVALDEVYKGQELGKWLCTQQCAKWQGTLKAPQEEQLQALADQGQLSWHPEHIWEAMMGLLMRWLNDPAKGQGRHCNVPRDEMYHGWALGEWLWWHRDIKRYPHMNVDRRTRFEMLVKKRQLHWPEWLMAMTLCAEYSAGGVPLPLPASMSLPASMHSHVTTQMGNLQQALGNLGGVYNNHLLTPSTPNSGPSRSAAGAHDQGPPWRWSNRGGPL